MREDFKSNYVAFKDLREHIDHIRQLVQEAAKSVVKTEGDIDNVYLLRKITMQKQGSPKNYGSTGASTIGEAPSVMSVNEKIEKNAFAEDDNEQLEQSKSDSIVEATNDSIALQLTYSDEEIHSAIDYFFQALGQDVNNLNTFFEKKLNELKSEFEKLKEEVCKMFKTIIYLFKRVKK